ncbi:tRNA (adenine(22)-N(1))-methyltransferase TrmK [Bacillus sp. UMB0899]|uniref:tRNA (adenine(22)-N(1))-methyltransferase n=1 Tax=Metabacillus schmidteae TaxID=2730405 RepID=UPI000C80F29F|nr:tRNA (adenine(22)-N(1))-methyltransferase TrmK [Metabacillus schmidteae]PMC39654.1 tRNA (adenine(22)-N(1))-methyltransferase TrmK [Bacillus sp. UMB0899]
MNELKLSKRLETVADYIPEGAFFADIGSDHAYLPCYSILQGRASGAIAGEITDGPYESARSQVKKCELSESIFVRKGDGLSVLRNDDQVDCITIAGMGGTLISKILEEGSGKLTNVTRLILQPNIHAISIRLWLVDNGWKLIAEEIIEEDHKIYEVLVAEKGDPKEPYQAHSYEASLLLGPFLAAKRSDIFMKKWTGELNHLKSIIKQLEQAGHTIESSEKYQELIKQVKLIEEVL